MVYSIFGFQQSKLIERSLTTNDALILKYLVDFMETKKMVNIEYKGEVYYWLDYKTLVEKLPILKLKKDSLYRRLKYMVELGILKHYTKREGGTFSFYALGDRYYDLLQKEGYEKKQENNHGEEKKENKILENDNKEENTETIINEIISKEKSKDKEVKLTNQRLYSNNQNLDSNSKSYSNSNSNCSNSSSNSSSKGKEFYKDPYGKKEEDNKDINQGGYGWEYETKDSLNNNSLNNNSLNKNKSYIVNTVKEVIKYLNIQCNKSFEAYDSKTAKLLVRLLSEGYDLEDFKRVIDNKSIEWIGTKFWEYLRPCTLFGDKFYKYVKEEFKGRGFNNFTPREYDFEDLEKKLLGWE